MQAMKYLLAMFVAVQLAGCGQDGVSRIAMNKIRGQSTTGLWIDHASTSSLELLSHIEAELVSRGEKTFAGDYIGKRTSAYVGRQQYQRSKMTRTSRDTLNCSDFSTELEAQRFFLANGGPVSDPHNLDGDGDGFACEWGTRVSKLAKDARRSTRKPPRYKPSYRTGYICHTGPRGGRYAIVNGRKDYSVC